MVKIILTIQGKHVEKVYTPYAYAKFMREFKSAKENEVHSWGSKATIERIQRILIGKKNESQSRNYCR